MNFEENEVLLNTLESAPEGEFVLLVGDSGYMDTQKFFITAKWDSERYDGDWIGVTGERVSDQFATGPYHGWLPLPKVKK